MSNPAYVDLLYDTSQPLNAKTEDKSMVCSWSPMITIAQPVIPSQWKPAPKGRLSAPPAPSSIRSHLYSPATPIVLSQTDLFMNNHNAQPAFSTCSSDPISPPTPSTATTAEFQSLPPPPPPVTFPIHASSLWPFLASSSIPSPPLPSSQALRPSPSELMRRHTVSTSPFTTVHSQSYHPSLIHHQIDGCVEDGLSEDEEDGQKEVTCLWKKCTLTCPNLKELIRHVRDTHIGSGKGLYYCEWENCTRDRKPFSKRHKMHNHFRTHTGEKPFLCDYPDCQKRFSRLDSLATHSKIHSNVRPYACPVPQCTKAYFHARSLRKHQRTHDQNASPFQHPTELQVWP